MPCIFYWLCLKIHSIFTLPTHVAETDISKKNNEKLYASDWTRWHTPISAAWAMTQDDYMFKIFLGYRASLKPACAMP